MNLNDDDVVISGISGRFPKSANLREFAQNLYNKVDMTDDSESRWKHFIPNVPKRFGKIQNLEKFDATFFSVLNKHASWTDPQMRMLLEHAYEAALDAGISPQSLVGSKTGVFVASSASEAKDAFTHRIPAKDGYIILGNANFYLSNRISYALGLSGPSFTIDAACSSSAYALDCAFHYMETGLCDAAFVGGSQLILANGLSEYTKLGVLALDGISRPFDDEASGFVRAETICVIFLQKFKDSKRVYANLVYSSSNNDGFKKEGTSFPSKILQRKLMDDFYKKVSVDPLKINFVEAHSTGTRLGDPEEVASIDEVFAKDKNRSKALIIGSVKSNMGHSEAASGMSSIAKVVIALENQKFPPNINLSSPRRDIEAFVEGRVKVATEIEPIEGEYIAMNSFGLGGANAHALLRGNTKIKLNFGIPDDNHGRMVLWSGRTEAAINDIFNDITERPLDAEHVALLQNSQTITTDANTYRGYGMFINDPATNKAICVNRNVQYFSGTRRPVVFVYSGIGSQWLEMGRDLMKIPMFAESIDFCHNILLNKGINLKDILTSTAADKFSHSVMNSYVGIIAIEIAFTDMLKAIGIVPDFIIGHSLGEVCCAYADGCFSAEQTILAAFARGEASRDSNSIEGAMAAVGLNHKNLEEILPEDIDIACHNGDDSTTISGPIRSINEVVEKLQAENIFAKAVASSGVALHSRYILDMARKLKEKLRAIVSEPKKRSQKWLSSTFPQDMWAEDEAKYSSAEYHTENLLNPVLFLEVCDKLPKNALTIEIAPHGLLKAILKRNLKAGIHISLTQRGCEDGMEFFMESLGSLFQHGIDMDISKLYPTVNFPVSRGTPMISPVIKWNHDINHFVPYYDSYNTFERSNMLVNISDKIFEFMQGNFIDGQYYFAEASWIILVWDHFSKMNAKFFEDVKVVFDDIQFLKSMPMMKNQDILITINIHRGSGRFEIIEGNNAIVNGYIKQVNEIEATEITIEDENEALMLTEDDFYKEMRVKGYLHLKSFQSVKKIQHDGQKGVIKWGLSWHNFIDAMLQVDQKRYNHLTRPTAIRKLTIDPILHKHLLNQKQSKDSEILFDVAACPHLGIIQSGGVEIHDTISTAVDRQIQKKSIVEVYSFIPFFTDEKFSKIDAAKIISQAATANIAQCKCSLVEIDSGDDERQPLGEFFSLALLQNPLVVSDVTLITSRLNFHAENVLISADDVSSFSGMDIVVASDCIGNEKFIKTAKSILNYNGYIVTREKQEFSKLPSDDLRLVLKIRTIDNEVIYMLEFKDESKIFKPEAIIDINKNVNEWLEPLKTSAKKGPTLIYACNQEPSGLIGFMNCVRREYSIDRLRCVFIMDTANAPATFDIDNPFYKSQLELNHAINIFKDGKWGSYRHTDMKFDKKLHPQKQHCVARCLNNDQLSWITGPNNVKDSIRIQYAAVNSKILNASSCHNLNTIGNEFSGIYEKSIKIMGIGLKSGAISTHYSATDSILWKIPENWKLDEAATVPLSYFTAYYGLFKSLQIQPRKTILINSGSSDLGQAAIRVAVAYGLDVFTVVIDEDNKNFLINNFPNLKPQNIGIVKFDKMIFRETKGKGVNYVLNTLPGDQLFASLRCLNRDGILLNVGSHDLSSLDGKFLKNSVSIETVCFENFAEDLEGTKTIQELMAKDLKAGIIKPLNAKIFNPHQLNEAFKYAKNNQHTEKVLIKIRETANDDKSLPLSAAKKIYFNSDESVVVAGGLGGFGLEMVEWLVSRGCKNLVLSSSRGVKTAYQQQKINLLKKLGATILISTSAIATEAGCTELLNQAVKLAPVAAIFNLAAVLRDGIFENLNEEMFIESLAPKGSASVYLDKLSRVMCPKLRHFVLFSSIASGRGYAGKANYGLSNSVLERIAEKRRESGFPGTAIQWGAIGDVGMLEEFQMKFIDDLYIGGMYPQTLVSCLTVFDDLILSDNAVVSSFVLADKHQDDLKKRNIVDIIFNIMGIRDKKSVSMTSTFTQLGIDSLMSVEIQQVLEREYDMSMKSHEIRSMSISQLEKKVMMDCSENAIKKCENEEVTAIKLTIQDIVNLDSFDPSKTFVKGNSVKASGNEKILILPGIFGLTTKAYEDLAQSMDYPAFILQLSDTFGYANLDELAVKLESKILQLFNDVDHFILIGHSFGALLALKIAEILENNDKIGQIIHLDGSPQFSARFARNMLNDIQFTDIKESISKLLEEYIKSKVNKDLKKLIIEKHDNFGAVTKELFSSVDKSSSKYEYFITDLPSEFTNRLNISLSTKEGDFCALKSTKMSLIKPKVTSINGIHRDYGLSRYTKDCVRIRIVEGDHWSMMDYLNLKKVVNELVLNNF